MLEEWLEPVVVTVPLAVVVEPVFDDPVPVAAGWPAPESHDTATNIRAAKTTNPNTLTANGASGNLDRLVLPLSSRPSFGALAIDSKTLRGSRVLGSNPDPTTYP